MGERIGHAIDWLIQWQSRGRIRGRVDVPLEHESVREETEQR
jgi:hypothetical protein